MSKQSSAELLEIAREAAHAAATVIRAAAPRLHDIVWQEKSATDFVSEVDLGAEAAAIAVIRSHLPSAGILAEESAAHGAPDAAQHGTVFVIDPLDGTTNFLHRVPAYAVSIGVLVDGELTAGIVLDVARDEAFTATRGGGAHRDGVLMHVSTISAPQRALLGTGFPFKDAADIAPYQAQMSRVMAGVSGVRRPGAAAIDLAWVAAGRFDAFWEHMLSPWDIAAGILLVQEAGGVVTDLAGAEIRVGHTGIVAGNAPMHGWLLEKINNE